MWKRILFILVVLGYGISGVAGASLSFTDITGGEDYVQSVRSLWTIGAISDDGSHLFRPNDPLTRDMLTALTEVSSCSKCMNPSKEVLASFTTSPYIDLPISNTYSYCISTAYGNGYLRTYPRGNDGKFTCQSGTKYSESPLCGSDTVTRMTAVKTLLDRSGLWSESRNSGYMKQVEIADVDRTWQGYAEKGIALGILSLGTDKKIHPNDILTRGEFAKMLSTMIDYNSCTFSDATIDTDGDGITDIHDTCPSVRGVAEKDGCPNIAVFNYGLTMEHILTGENKGSSDPTDRDGDGIRDSEDLCPTLVGTSANAGCPGISIMSGIPENKCLAEVFQNRGIMFASPVCATCPCENSINMQSLVRTCDVIFPAVLSKDEKTVYSRGDLFLIH